MSSEPPDRYPDAVADRWAAVLDDARATADEYREDGWDVLVIHTGDVTPLTGDPFGLSVLAPGDEFASLQALVDDAAIDRTHVYRADADDVRFYVVVAEASEADHAVVVPAFLVLSEAPPLRERAESAGVMYTHVRPLADDARVTFTHEDPSPFF